MNSKRLFKSYIWVDGECFFVSTIERDSSAAAVSPPLRFCETLVWEFDWDNNKKGKLLAEAAEGQGFDQHYEMCRRASKGEIE